MEGNFIIYHFLVKSKPHERIDLMITASVNIYQTKIPIVMKTCFSYGKLIQQFGTPPPPPSTNSPISKKFFHDPPLCLNFKNKTPLALVLRGGQEIMYLGSTS